CRSPTGNRPRRGCAARRCHGPGLALSWLARARPRRQHGRRVVGRPGHPVFGSRLGVGIAVVLAGFATVGRRVILAVVALVGIADTLLHAMCNIGLAFGGWFNAVVAISGIGTIWGAGGAHAGFLMQRRTEIHIRATATAFPPTRECRQAVRPQVASRARQSRSHCWMTAVWRASAVKASVNRAAMSSCPCCWARSTSNSHD